MLAAALRNAWNFEAVPINLPETASPSPANLRLHPGFSRFAQDTYGFHILTFSKRSKGSLDHPSSIASCSPQSFSFVVSYGKPIWQRANVLTSLGKTVSKSMGLARRPICRVAPGPPATNQRCGSRLAKCSASRASREKTKPSTGVGG